MCKKCWITVSILIALTIVLAFAIPALSPPTPGVTYANYSRIEKGMTREQVERLLGQPLDPTAFRRIKRSEDSNSFLFWRTETDDDVEVFLDHNGCVAMTAWNHSMD